MIRRAQTLGFALSELKGLVAHKAEHGRFPLDIANDLINRKRDRLHAEMQDIIRQNDSLQVLQDELNRTYASMPAAECTTPGAGA
jgi:DNA-binding transcriptional MerR regulator